MPQAVYTYDFTQVKLSVGGFLIEGFEKGSSIKLSRDEDAFTDKVREFDEISRLDAQKTSLLLEIKNKIKESAVDIT